MAQELYTLSLDSIKYITGLINQIVNLPNDVINNTNLADNLTFSNIHIKNLIDQCLIDANTEAQKLVGALTHLTCEKTTTQPTLESSKTNVIYLHSIDGNPPFQQFLKISDTELIDLGSTSISLNDYLTATEIASTYAKQIDLDTLTDEINNIKNDIGTETITTTATTVKGAINELNDKKIDIKTTLDENSTDADVCSGKAIFDAIKKNCIGKETVLYEGNISATGTYTLADDVNNYDFIMIATLVAGATQTHIINRNSWTLANPSGNLQINHGNAASNYYVNFRLSDAKLIVIGILTMAVKSIVGYKFGEITVANTITNPSPPESYSTDEQLTGGTWIDGKPIYRKVLSCTTATAIGYVSAGVNHGGFTSVPGWTVANPNISDYINIRTTRPGGKRIDNNILANKSLQFYSLSGAETIIVGEKLIIEYTKTTDA